MRKNLITTNEIGLRLRKLRGNRTLQKVSDDTGLGVSAITMYELGQRMPRDEAKLALAMYYGVSIDDLFFNPNFTISEA